MHRLLKSLNRDHKNLARVLKIMESELHHLVEGRKENLQLMRDASIYIQQYPDLIHHPKENLIYDAFSKRSFAGSEIVTKLKMEHDTLPTTTVRFQILLDSAMHGLEFVNRDMLVKNIQVFLKNQCDHINIEEKVLFPLIDDTLTDADWVFIESQMRDARDPLFNVKIEENFHNLYESMKAEAKV